MDEPAPRPRTRRTGLSYLVIASAAMALALGVAALLTLGTDDPAPAAGAAPSPAVLDTTARFLLALVLVLALSHGLGALLRRLGQPAVVGEMAAGIALGPTIFGALLPGVWHGLFPAAVLGGIDLAAQLGLVVFMFLVGWELDLSTLRPRGHTITAVSFASLAAPFVAGLALALWFFPGFAGTGVSFRAFGPFVGLALAVTALPVLARILEERGRLRTPIGALIVASAAVEDVAAWAMLAVTLALAGLTTALPGGVVLALTAAFVVLMLGAARPGLHRLVHTLERRENAEFALLPLVLVGALAAATATQAIGIHAILGAFLFGVIMPRHTRTSETLATRIRSFTMAALLPLFFAAAGMHVSIGGVGSTAAAWVAPLALVVTAMLTKLLGAGIAARATGLGRRDAYRVGVLMNCRGLTGIVIADVGLQRGVIDERMFTVLVLTALVTTAVTVPLLALAGPFGSRPGRSGGAAGPVPAVPEPVPARTVATSER
ncbi:hypothetical protein Asp14428_76330 [Actinoplanes sp. NBRC 14428]|nr:hypothetical protein Asp14428_76330 [Actinoplanes sp. NBRC 14428]